MELPPHIEAQLSIARSAYNRATWADLSDAARIAFCETATAAYNVVAAMLELELEAQRAKRHADANRLFSQIEEALKQKPTEGEIEGARVGAPVTPESSSHG